MYICESVWASPIVQSVAYSTWEQEVTGLIPGSANILSKDWW